MTYLGVKPHANVLQENNVGINFGEKFHKSSELILKFYFNNHSEPFILI